MMQENSHSGLFVVATPIGCLSDWSYRAIDVMKQADLILAEDTRHSRVLLDYYHIDRPLKSLHRFNEKAQADALVSRLLAGESMAIISDAGTPLISDPGHPLVLQCHARGVRVIPIPGPCALTAALSASGLGANGFTFLGFLPVKSSERQALLQQFVDVPLCLAFYEAPHRIEASLHDLYKIVGPDREVCVAREMTKRYETIKKDTLVQLIHWLASDPQQLRGEFVVMVARGEELPPDENEAKRVFALLKPLLSHKDAARLTAEITGVAKNIIYAWHQN